ncbi:MAG: hypothetical protein JSR19_03515 [Proteobacteria bacterium]|nr:hypothetical protein [Pseudomonadota bacterium]HQR04988.1 hypothetical protein [Rhodocyclaceae bacterium]
MRFSAAIAALSSLVAITLAPLALAEPIERIKLTDNDLSCPDIYKEIGEMNKIMGVARDTRDGSSTTATAADVAQSSTGLAVQAAAASGSYGAAMGLAQAAPFIGLFGKVAKGVADSKEKESAERLGDAKARKEHLSGLFINKGCKVADLEPSRQAAPGQDTPKKD